MFLSLFLVSGMMLGTILVLLPLSGLTRAKTLPQQMVEIPQIVAPILSSLHTLPQAEDAEPGIHDVSVLFLGDMMFDRTVATRMKKAGSSSYPFENIGGFRSGTFGRVDLLVGNLEGPLTAKKAAPVKSIDFSFDPYIAKVLKDQGFDAVSQANNHTLDQGRGGAEESRKTLLENGIGVFGDQVRDDAANSLTVLQANGKKIALVGFNITDNLLDKAAARASIDQALVQADRTIVVIHWGSEYKAKPNPDQVALAHWFIDLGVDAVIGGHPHWMQGVESYQGKPIVYSLGNLIFDQDWSEETNYGLAVTLNLKESGTSLDFFPIQIVKSQPNVLQGSARQQRLDRLAEISDPALAEGIKKGELSF
ncbi:MAG: CapA family protein [Patescibacteria group bacterium]|nr:CapA family protein [Patescibacteria group bacterium]